MGSIINHQKLAKVIPITSRVRIHDVTEVLRSGQWSNKRCLIFGGGPSLIGFDYGSVADELTIGINKSFELFSPTINYSMDLRFHDLLQDTKDRTAAVLRQKWAAYKGIKLFFRRDNETEYTGVYTVKALGKRAISYDLSAGIWEGANSGFGAMMLAIALGSTRIGLLGYDMTVDQKAGRTHCHEGYGQDPMDLQTKLNRFRQEFEEFGPAILSHGISVFNLNPASAIQCFPKCNLAEFLQDKQV
jgi:hypothetical protein